LSRYSRTRYRSLRQLTRCTGLEDPWNRNKQLNRAWRKVCVWFKSQGGEVFQAYLIDNPKVKFFKYRLPAVQVPERVARARIARNRQRRKRAMAPHHL